MKPRSLSRRITALLLGSSVVILGAGSRLMDWRIDSELERRFNQELLTQAQALIAPIVVEPDRMEPDTASWLPLGMVGGDSKVFYLIRCGDTELAQSTPPPPQLPAGWGRPWHEGALAFSQLGNGWNRHLGSVMLDFQAPLGQGWGVDEDARERAWASSRVRPMPRQCRILLVQSRHQLNQILVSVDWILLLSPLLALLIALLAVPLIVRRGLRPLGQLGEQMAGIGPQAPGQRLPATGIRELEPLVQRFNGVLERMDEGLARERQFASGVAHETRTRLAELRALTEVEQRYPSGRSSKDILAELGSIGAELEATVSALLLLTRLQSGLHPAQRQPLELAPWLQRISQHARATAARREVALALELAPDVSLETDPALLEVALGNLLGNACAYAPPGDTVHLRGSAQGLSIDNAAPGLEPADLAQLGQRFWRKQKPDPSHAGLGLALADAAAQALGWQLRFELRQGRLFASLQPQSPRPTATP